MVAFLLGVMLMPVLTLILLLYLVSNQGPVFFIQRRIGLHEKPFDIIKFRTISWKTLPDGTRYKETFLLGTLLRKFSLDEIPQLWHVLNMQMSLVGPRPLLPEYLNHYSIDQRKRHRVKPGITGWAQVNGRNRLTWTDRFDLDLYYVRHASFLLDLKILLLTLANYMSFTDVIPDFDQPFQGNQ